MSKPTTTALLVAAAVRHHACATRPTIAEGYAKLVRDFAAENRRRCDVGLPMLLCPSLQTLVRAIRGPSVVDTWTARFGAAHARRRFHAMEDQP